MVEINEYTAHLKKQFSHYKKHLTIPIPKEVYVKCYKNKFDKKGTKVLIDNVIDAIKQFDGVNEYPKKNIRPIVLFSVSENHTSKEAINVTKHSGFIVLDIDKKDYPNKDFVELKKEICLWKYAYACFNSPSGGLKVIVNTNIKDLKYHKVFYFAVVDLFLYMFKLPKVDTSGSDVSRQCYFSYDPIAYFNPDARRFFMDENEILSSPHIILSKSSIKRNIKNGKDFTIDNYDDYYNIYSNLIKKGTSVGLYDCIFNKYRFDSINNILLSTSVPFLENFLMIQLENDKLDFKTRIDEVYFEGKDKQEPIFIDEGICYTEIRFGKDTVIKEGKRNKTIYLITLKLIFNNPFVKFDRLLSTVTRLYHRYKDHDAKTEFTDKEIHDIVDYNFKRYINGLMDFTPIIRKNEKGKIKPKYVFFSREYIMTSIEDKRLVAINKYHEGKREKVHKEVYGAMEDLQDGKKITNKRIAILLGISERTVKRKMKDYPQLADIKDSYNSLLKKKNDKSKVSETVNNNDVSQDYDYNKYEKLLNNYSISRKDATLIHLFEKYPNQYASTLFFIRNRLPENICSLAKKYGFVDLLEFIEISNKHKRQLDEKDKNYAIGISAYLHKYNGLNSERWKVKLLRQLIICEPDAIKAFLSMIDPDIKEKVIPIVEDLVKELYGIELSQLLKWCYD